jgi:predicted CXXCH cytochrome family protein
MSARETGKDRAARIPYNYQHQRDRQIRRRLLLSGAALAAVLAWLGKGALDVDAGRSRASPGPLSGVHATWETQCDACHTPWPGFRAALESRPYGVVSEAGDARCKNCHMDQPQQAHHPTRRPDQVPNCATCHTEHRGAEAALVRRDEDHCTSCHRDLDMVRMRSPGADAIDGMIAHFFDQTHPPFRRREVDPGRIKFNHALHLARGVKYRKDDVPLFTFAQLRDADRPRYGWEEGRKQSDPVQLECASCHRLEGPRTIPLTFENQCAACHALNVAAADRDRPDDLLTVRHGLQPALLHDDLIACAVHTLLSADEGRLDALEPRHFPGHRPQVETARREVERRVATIERMLFGRGKGVCTECHYYDSSDGEPVLGPDGGVEPARSRIVTANIPNPWFEHARFKHSAHAGLTCRACHARAYADDDRASGRPVGLAGTGGAGLPRLENGKETWTAHEDVLLPEITVCKECHAPARASSNPTLGRARHDCTECHTYHHRAPPGTSYR